MGASSDVESLSDRQRGQTRHVRQVRQRERTDNRVPYIYEWWETDRWFTCWNGLYSSIYKNKKQNTVSFHYIIHLSHYPSISVWHNLIYSQSGFSLSVGTDINQMSINPIRFNLTIGVQVSLHQQDKQGEQKDNVPATNISFSLKPLCPHRATV